MTVISRRTRSNTACRRNGVGWSIAYSVSLAKLIDRNFRFYFSIGKPNRRGSNHSVPPCIQSGNTIGLGRSWRPGSRRLLCECKIGIWNIKIYSRMNIQLLEREHVFSNSRVKNNTEHVNHAHAQSYRILLATTILRGKNFCPRIIHVWKIPKFEKTSYENCFGRRHRHQHGDVYQDIHFFPKECVLNEYTILRLEVPGIH